MRSISGSSIGVSGLVDGLAVLVLKAINSLGGCEVFHLALVIAGVLQIIMGYIKAGVTGYKFPSSVIKGMLTVIGIVNILNTLLKNLRNTHLLLNLMRGLHSTR